MQVQIEDVSPVEKKLSFEIPWETVQERLGDAYKELAKGVALKGFRKGKVPQSVIKRMFGKQVRAEVAGQLVRDSFVQAVQEHNLQVVSEPTVHDEALESGKPFKFHAHVEVRAPVELDKKDYEGLELEKRTIAIDDAAVDQALEELRRQHTDLQPIEGRDVTGSGDVLSLSIKGTIGDQEVDRPQFMVDLGEAEREALPGLVKALTGLPIDVKDHRLELDIPDDYAEEELRGKKTDLTISILDARQKQVPELDDEFAKDTERAETLDELKKVLRDELEKRAEEEQQRELRDGAVKALVKRNQIPVADGLIERAAESQLQRLKSMIGLPPEASGEGLIDDDMRQRMRESAADDVRGEFLIEAVATAEDVQVSDEDVDERVAEFARNQGKPANRVKAELEREGRLDEIRFSMRRQKTLDLLIGRATIKEVEAGAGGDEPQPGAEAVDATAEAPAAEEKTE